MKFDLAAVLFSINKHDLACYYAVYYAKAMPLSWGVHRRVSITLSTLACDLQLSTSDVLHPVRMPRFKSWVFKWSARFGLVFTDCRVGADCLIDYLACYYSARLCKSFADYWCTHRIADTLLVIDEATSLYKQYIAQGDLVCLCDVFLDAFTKLGYDFSRISVNNYYLPFSCAISDLIPEFKEYYSRVAVPLFYRSFDDTDLRLYYLQELRSLYASKLM